MTAISTAMKTTTKIKQLHDVRSLTGNNMNILMISDVFFPRVNGVSTSIQTFTDTLLDQGHRVTLIAPDYPETYNSQLTVIRIPSKRLPFDPEDRLMSKRAIKKLLPQLQQQQFDIIHIQTPFVAHYAGIYLAKKLNKRTKTDSTAEGISARRNTTKDFISRRFPN